jgi:cytochrome P450
MNVLARIAYGRRTPFALSSSLSDSSTNISYVDAISLCTELLVPAAFLPARLLRLPIMPQLLQTLGVALERLPNLTQDMLNQERQRSCAVTSATDHTTAPTLSSGSNTIMSTLVRLSDQGKDHTDDTTSTSLEKHKAKTGGSGAGSSYLSEEEIAGNLFIFTAAGFDTTANTMSYAVALLAAYPEWQVWIQTEIDTVLGGPQKEPGAEMPLPEYTTVFPKLMRCLAVMVC